jgi:hypothetical protein
MVEVLFPIPLDATTCEAMALAVTGITVAATLVTNHYRNRQERKVHDLKENGIPYLPEEREKRRRPPHTAHYNPY